MEPEQQQQNERLRIASQKSMKGIKRISDDIGKQINAKGELDEDEKTVAMIPESTAIIYRDILDKAHSNLGKLINENQTLQSQLKYVDYILALCLYTK